jgi:ATP-dependent RNA helicase DeaD
LINDQQVTSNIEIGQIEILDTFSFFEIDKSFESQTLNAFQENDPEFSGRSVSVEITKKQRSGRGSDRRGGGKGKRKSNKQSNDFSGFGRKRRSGNSQYGKDTSSRKRRR